MDSSSNSNSNSNNNNNNNNIEMNDGEDSFLKRITLKTNQYLSTITLTTRFFFILCVVIFILECVNLLQVWKLCFAPYSFISNPILNGYKIITSSFLHINFIHLLFNMMAFIPLGTRAEKSKFGSIAFFYLIMLFSILIPLVVVVVSSIASFTNISRFGYYSCSVGFSSIVFALLEIEFYEDRVVSLYGIANIPSKLYPFAILFFTSLLFPSSSFIGHLSGIIIGLLFVKGYLSFLILSSEKCIKIEMSEKLTKITTSQGFITNINYGSSFYNSSTTSSSLDNSISRIRNYFSRTAGGVQLGSISPDQFRQQQRQQQQQQQQDPIQLQTTTNQQPNINNIDDDNNGHQIPMYGSTSLQYSPLIDMSKDNPQPNDSNK